MLSDDREPSWELMEKIVTILERHIGPNATVQHDVKLPVLSSNSGRTRQCDIVIVQGTEPRKTISIVEVQKRKSKPEINEFDGWVEKMREVGAQHLICVSETGYPKSIEEKADKIGPTVRLLTLKQLEKDNWPIPNSIFSKTLVFVNYDELVGLQMKYIHLVRMNPNNEKKLPNTNEKIFRLENKSLVSITDILDWYLFGNPENLDDLPRDKQFVLRVKFDDGFEHKTYDGNWVKLKSLEIHIKIFITNKNLNWQIKNYEQRKYGQVAWVMRGEFNENDKQIDIIIPLENIAPGQYRMGNPINVGDYETFMSFGDKKYKAEHFKG